MEGFMDDEIKKMLIEGYRKTDPEEFEREAARLFITAQENTNHVYKSLMEKILKEYQTNPLKDSIFVIFRFYKSYYNSGMGEIIRKYYLDKFAYDLSELTETCNTKYGNEVYWTEVGPYLKSLLIRKIQKDGFTVDTQYDRVEISTDEFRRVMNKLIAEDNQKRR